MVRVWHGRGMASVNQTRPHCVNQRGKKHSKPLVARHGRGTAWPRHAMCESARSVIHAGHSTYNVTMRGVLVTIVAVEKQQVLNILSVSVCSLRYPACSAHVPYCYLLPVQIFFHFISNGTFLKNEKLLNTKCVF
jgi:hypothetical protein